VLVAAVCVALPVLVASGVVTGAQRSWGSATIEDVARQQAPHADVVRGCDHEPAALEIDRCLWPATHEATFAAGDDHGLVVLLGDSDAGAISEVVADAANEDGFDLREATLHGCFFADARIVKAGSDGARCRDSVLSLVDRAIAASPRAVVLSTVTDRYLEEASSIVQGSTTAHGDDAMRAAATAGLRSVIERFDAAGIPVLVVQPVPKFRDWTFDTCPMIRLLRDVGSCGVTRDRATVLSELAPARAVGSAAVSGLDAVAVDFTDVLCLGDRCTTFAAGVWEYHDAVHLTVQGARPMSARLQSELAALTADR
jgi:hypothetical protein